MRTGSLLTVLAWVFAVSSCGGGTTPAPTPMTKPPAKPAAKPPVPAKLTPAESAAALADGIHRAYKACIDVANRQSVEGVVNCFADSGTSAMVDGSRDNNKAEIRASMIRLWKGVPDMTRKSQIMLINGPARKTATVLLETATHKGQMGPLKPTNKRIGFFGVQLIDWDADNLIKSNIHFFDQATVLAQLGIIKFPHRPLRTGLAFSPIIVKATGSAAEKANLALVDSLAAAVSARDVDRTFAAFEPSATYHHMAGANSIAPLTNIKRFFGKFFAAFPDLRKTHVTSFAAGDWVFVHGRWEGTNTGPSSVLGMSKPTGKKLKYHTAEFYRLAKGKVVQYWGFNDRLTMIQQLGLMGGGGKPATKPSPQTKP